jgi:hypothetical protein
LDSDHVNEIEELKREYEEKIKEENLQVTESLNTAKEVEIDRWKQWLEDANNEVKDFFCF